MPTSEEALPGRDNRAYAITPEHAMCSSTSTRRALFPPVSRTALFGLGCFWGAERKFWQMGDGNPG